MKPSPPAPSGNAQQDTLPNTLSHRSYSPSIQSLPQDRRPPSQETFSSDSGPQVVYNYLEWDTPIPEEEFANLPPSIRGIKDPFSWSSTQKSITLLLACTSTFLAAFVVGAYTSAIEGMDAEWHVGKTALLGGLTLFCGGFAISPMFLAPLSEVSTELHDIRVKING